MECNLAELVKRATKEASGDVTSAAKKRRKTQTGSSSDSIEEDAALLVLLEHCSAHPEDCSSVWHYLSTDLSKRDAIRLPSLQVVDALFHGCAGFRTVVTDAIDLIASCGGLLRADTQASLVVRAKVLELLALWDHVYGLRYPKVHVLARFLRESEKIKLPDIRTRLEQLKAQRLAEEAVGRRRAALRAGNAAEELGELLQRAEHCMDIINQCFNLLFPSIESISGSEEAEDIHWEQADGAAADSAEDSDPLAGAAPYTIEISISSSARDIAAEDGSLLLDCLEDAARDLVRNLLPRAAAQRHTVICGIQAVDEDLRLLSEGSAHAIEIAKCADERARLVGARDRADEAMERAKELLTQRCKALFATAAEK